MGVYRPTFEESLRPVRGVLMERRFSIRVPANEPKTETISASVPVEYLVAPVSESASKASIDLEILSNSIIMLVKVLYLSNWNNVFHSMLSPHSFITSYKVVNV